MSIMKKKSTKKHHDSAEVVDQEVPMIEEEREREEVAAPAPVEEKAPAKHEPPLDSRLELLLDPKAGPKFEKVLSRQEWEKVQAKAKQFLDEKKDARGVVRGHWQGIIDGKVPFGFEVIG